MKKFSILLVLSLLVKYSCAQSKDLPHQWIFQNIQHLLETQGTVLDPADIEISINDWLNEPLLLNKASAFELAKFFFLNPQQVKNLGKHLEKFGPFLDKYELQSIEGFDEQTAQLLSYFVQIEERKAIDYYSLAEILENGKQEVIIGCEQAFQESKGFQNPKQFVGSNQRIALRYRFALANKLYFGFSAEKDAGEKWGLFGDFQGFHLLYKGHGLLQTLAIGDYQANFGKGLNIGSAMFNGKSALVFQNQYLNEGIRPYRSLNESGFFRGVALAFKKKHFTLNLMGSLLPQTAGLQFDSLLQEEKFGSIVASGLHRTNAELAKKNSLINSYFGIHGMYQKRKLQIGLSYSKQENISSQNIENGLKNWQYPFINCHWGLAANYYLQNILLGTEFSVMENGAKAIFASILIPLHAKLDAMFIGRNYEKGYENNYGNAWSASSSIGNETGNYLAFSFRPKKYHQIDFYYDIFKSSGPSYQAAYAKVSYDYFVHYTWMQSKTFQIELRLRQLETEKNTPLETSQVKTMAPETRSQFRFQVNFSINKNLTYQLRAEKILAQKTVGLKYEGQLIFHDINFHPKGEKFSLHARFCLFQVADFSARLYMQESDVMYNYAQSLINGNGYRTYLIVGYRLFKNALLQLKIGQSYLPEKTEIGSGIDQTKGPFQGEGKIQFYYKW